MTGVQRHALVFAAILWAAGALPFAQAPARPDARTHESSWVSGPNVMCGGYGGFGLYRTAVTLRYVTESDGRRRLVDAVANVSSQTFVEHPQNNVSVVMEVLQGSRPLSRVTLTPRKAEVAGGTRAPEDAQPNVLPAGTVVTLPKGATLRVSVTPDVMIDLPSCVPALCAWCSLGTSTHQIALP